MPDSSRPLAIPGVETFHRREAWQDPAIPVTGPAPTMGEWDTFPLHYTAADDLIDGDPGEHAEDLPQYLRNIQHYYKTAPTRGYSVGYGFAVDWLGGVWELRGFDIKHAANKYWNHRTCAVLCLVDGADPLTAEALWSVRAIYREAERRCGRSLKRAGHRDIGVTPCPGDGIYGQIQRGEVTPLTDAELNPEPPQETDMGLKAIRGRIRDKDGTLYDNQVTAQLLANPSHALVSGATSLPLREFRIDATRAEIEADLGIKLRPAGS